MKRVLLSGFFGALLAMPGWAEDPKQDVFDRVTSSGNLRCGYGISYPNLVKDPNTGQLSGVTYDVTNALSDKLGLKVVWAEETGFGSAEQGLNSGRYDLVCSDVCIEPRRTKFAWFSRVFNPQPIFLIGREKDARFDVDINQANNPEVKVAVVDNTILDSTAAALLPRAHRMDVGEFGVAGDFMLSVASGKADLTINNGPGLDRFIESNPDTVKQIGSQIGLCQGAFMLPLGDVRFKVMIDSAMDDLISEGRIDAILTDHLGSKKGRYWLSPLSMLVQSGQR
jgi:ABC-type amino acid transport substrate-binding protein